MSIRGSVLVVGPSWVGDMVMAQALYRLLVERSPGVSIDVLAPPWSLPIIARMAEVRRGIELRVNHGELALGRRRALGLALRKEHYSRAIVLPRSYKAALTPWFARIPRRTGFRGEWRYGLLNDVRASDPRLDQTVKRFVALGAEPTEAPLAVLPPRLRPRLALDQQNAARLRREHGIAEDSPIVVLMPGAEYGPAKRWPLERFAVVAASLARQGVDVLVLGSAKERDLGEGVRTTAADARVRNLCGLTTLGDVVDLCAVSHVAVTNDSGLLHVAAAAGTHVVAIYGSSSPDFTPPLTAHRTVLYQGLDCSPCFERTCPLGHLRCLHEIDPAAVVSAVETAMQSAPARASRVVKGELDG